MCVVCNVRLYKENMLMHFVDIGKRPPVFEDAARVALELLQTPYEFDFGQMYYNVFRFLLFSFIYLFISDYKGLYQHNKKLLLKYLLISRRNEKPHCYCF